MTTIRLLFSSALAIGAVTFCQAEPNTLEFAKSGLAAGSINGQEGWKVNVQAPANAGFVVAPGKGLELTDNTGGTHAVSYAFLNDRESTLGRDRFDAGMPLSTTINFTIRQEPGPKKGPIVGLGWGLFVPVGPNCLPFSAEFARDTEAGGYKLKFVKHDDKTTVDGETVVVIPEEALGLGDGDAESDPLQLSLTQTNQGTPAEWTTVSMLTNLKTKKNFVLKNTVTAPGVYKTDDFIRAVVNLRRAGEDGLSSVILSQLDADPAVDPSAQ